ncbi:uncharacterized protein SCHCODRAFT_02730367 [Schizophyllum commune H4-8]|uniref:uncharacterized protein n=1 Tax=Schizophyllum commune (strain H4-8 / FGSC 9210) TaxID=578458 RepID=UPI00215FF6B4|nr:uncharacterized protein SCHCODRAFT_02730367 [Schizophyllum commune H4-8]KAI5893742.1 hypothetical protein SCHCODRAFT_02730367 [Schizophyllum commune H4-8]
MFLLAIRCTQKSLVVRCQGERTSASSGRLSRRLKRKACGRHATKCKLDFFPPSSDIAGIAARLNQSSAELSAERGRPSVVVIVDARVPQRLAIVTLTHIHGYAAYGRSGDIRVHGPSIPSCGHNCADVNQFSSSPSTARIHSASELLGAYAQR